MFAKIASKLLGLGNELVAFRRDVREARHQWRTMFGLDSPSVFGPVSLTAYPLPGAEVESKATSATSTRAKRGRGAK